MLELVRYQRNTLQKAAGGEDLVLSASDMLSSERKGMKSNGKYIEKMQHHTSLHIQKVFAIRENLRLI